MAEDNSCFTQSVWSIVCISFHLCMWYIFLCADVVTRKPKSSRLLENLLCCFRPTSSSVVQQTPPPPPPHLSSLPTSPTTLTTSTTETTCYTEDHGYSIPSEVAIWLSAFRVLIHAQHQCACLATLVAFLYFAFLVHWSYIIFIVHKNNEKLWIVCRSFGSKAPRSLRDPVCAVLRMDSLV